jgi:hypothetical protein
MWDLLFSITFKSQEAQLVDIMRIFKLLETVIPCPRCRNSYVIHRQRLDKKYMPIESVYVAREWLYEMKTTVSTSIGQKNPLISMNTVRNRYMLFDHFTSDTNLADLLMLMAIALPEDKEDKFVEFCNLVGKLTIHFLSSPLPALLMYTTAPTKKGVLDATNALREGYGMTRRTHEHYMMTFNDRASRSS